MEQIDELESTLANTLNELKTLKGDTKAQETEMKDKDTAYYNMRKEHTKAVTDFKEAKALIRKMETRMQSLVGDSKTEIEKLQTRLNVLSTESQRDDSMLDALRLQKEEAELKAKSLETSVTLVDALTLQGQTTEAENDTLKEEIRRHIQTHQQMSQLYSKLEA